jgi:hypothetical protein
MSVAKVERYLWNIFLWLDQGLNTLLGGDPRETLSSRMGKYLRDKRKCVLCKVLCTLLNVIDKNHCAENIEDSLGSKSLTGRY